MHQPGAGQAADDGAPQYACRIKRFDQTKFLLDGEHFAGLSKS
jgi:hypothetical protein